MAFDLYPFQRDMVKGVRNAFKTDKHILTVMPTGTGKTVLSGFITQKVYNDLSGKTPSIALYLVHRKELINQTVETLGKMGFKLGEDVGIIASGHNYTPWAPLQVASIQTIVKRIEKLHWLKPRLVWVDECHHARARTWEKVLHHFDGAYRIGLTATPTRLDGKGLKEMFSVMVEGPQISDVVPQFLAPTRTYSVPSGVDLKKMTLSQQAQHAVKGPVIANAVTNWVKLARDRKTIFFCVDREHSMRNVEQLKAIGVNAEHLDFKTPDRVREQRLEDFRNGNIQVVSNYELFTEGVDAPACSAVVIARSVGSFSMWRQMNGRMMRKKPDGGDGLCIDLADNVHGHGHGAADQDVEWSLETGIDMKATQAKAALYMTCMACGFEYPKTNLMCPQCKFAPVKKETEVNEVDAQVELVEKDDKKKKIRVTKRTLSEEIRKTKGEYGKLEILRKKYGYHANWPNRMIKIYFPNIRT